jgi:hypothetical protein
MTTFRPIEANRRNALKSPGPKTETGKDRSRRNAVRHGLTAETVIGSLEDAEDYRQFEAAIIADYDAQSAVERELVLRLASVMWRLRRTNTMETGLFEIQAEHLREYQHSCRLLSDAHFIRAHAPSHDHTNKIESAVDCGKKSNDRDLELAQCFLHLANLPNFALDRLNRYEARLWRQARQILYALEVLDRRKPHERAARFWFAGKKQIEPE